MARHTQKALDSMLTGGAVPSAIAADHRSAPIPTSFLSTKRVSVTGCFVASRQSHGGIFLSLYANLPVQTFTKTFTSSSFKITSNPSVYAGIRLSH